MPSSADQPANALRGFFAAMCEWERSAFARMEAAEETEEDLEDEVYDALFEQKCAELSDVFSKYCTSRNPPERNRPYGDPTEYDPDEERILEVREEGDTISIYTECTSPNRWAGKWMYILVKDGDQWKVDERREYENGKYKKCDL